MQIMVDPNTDSAKELELAGYFLLELADVKSGKTPSAPHVHDSQDTGDYTPREQNVDYFSEGGRAEKGKEPLTTAYVFPPPPPPTAASVAFEDPEVTIEDDSGDENVTYVSPISSAFVEAVKTIGTSTFPPAPPGPAVAAVYDSAGTPWDERIHQGGRARKLDGTWKIRKRLGKDFLAVVEAELAVKRQVPAGTYPQNGRLLFVPPPAPIPIGLTDATAPATASNAAPAAANVPPPPPIPPAAPVSSSAPPPPPPTSVILPPPATNGAPPAPVAVRVLPSDGSVTFKELMTTVSGALKSQKLSKDQLDMGMVSVGLEANQLGVLASRPELIPALTAYINGILQA